MRFDRMCRTCLGEGDMTSIFEVKRYDEYSISAQDMLLACATVTVTEKDGLPCQICNLCMKQLYSAYKFRRLCENSFSIMLDYVAQINKSLEIKQEKDEINIFSSKIEELGLLIEDDIKDEKDSIKGEEECGEIIHNRYSPNFDNEILSPMKLESKQMLRRLERERKKIKRAKRKKMKLLKQKPIVELLTCSLCPKTFKWKYLLIAHQDSHIGIKRYFCELCGKSYRNEKDHTKMHKLGRKYKCEICSKCFNSKSKLTTHIETHAVERERRVCTVVGCNKSFLSAVGLDRHRLSHTGLKNLICHLCSKSFVDKYQLEIHIRSHTNERPHPCRFCSKSFITTSARTTHERWHTNTKNFQCNYCDKSFVSSSGRKRHLLIHSKEQHQSCRFCGKKFSRCDNKKRHEMAMHGISDDKILQST